MMNKTILAVQLFISLSFVSELSLAQESKTPQKFSKEEVVVTWGKDNKISTLDLEAEITANLTSAEREKTRSNPQSVSQIMSLRQIYRVLAERAKASGHSDNDLIKKASELASERVLAVSFLDAEIEKYRKSLPNLEPAAREFYEVNKQKFKQNYAVEARHILYSPKKHGEKAAEEKAIAMLKRVQNNEHFLSLVTDTDDTSVSRNGGNLGFITKGKTVKEFEDAIFSMKIGEHRMVKTEYGFHVVTVLAIQDEKIKDYSEVKNNILFDLENKAVEEFKNRYVNEIEKDPTIKVNEDVFMRFTDSIKKPARTN